MGSEAEKARTSDLIEAALEAVRGERFASADELLDEVMNGEQVPWTVMDPLEDAEAALADNLYDLCEQHLRAALRALAG